MDSDSDSDSYSGSDSDYDPEDTDDKGGDSEIYSEFDTESEESNNDSESSMEGDDVSDTESNVSSDNDEQLSSLEILGNERKRIFKEINKVIKPPYQKYPITQRYVYKKGDKEKYKQIKHVLKIDKGHVYDTWGGKTEWTTKELKFLQIKVKIEEQFKKPNGTIVGEGQKTDGDVSIGWGLRATDEIKSGQIIGRMVLPEIIEKENNEYNDFFEKNTDTIDPGETVVYAKRTIKKTTTKYRIFDRFMYEAFKEKKYVKGGKDFKPLWFLANSSSPLIKNNTEFFNRQDANASLQGYETPHSKSTRDIKSGSIILHSYIGDKEKKNNYNKK